ncbi:hypothetical protein [Ralstonia pseudosolanacearum]|uniref:hypothetical protein n=1 Tax=Ralstonia pseudosolanacearum TaxID=1310165 RepID=UPI0013748055|nr:hypothetical protein [Ralstonia pseudosolanacearum]
MRQLIAIGSLNLPHEAGSVKSMGVKTSANNQRCGKGRYREVDKSSLAQLAGLNCVAEGKRKG